MITFAFDAGGLVKSRFAVSRLAELTIGLEVLAHPDRAPYARSWVEQTRRRLDLRDIAVLFALIEHPSWYIPDFVVPVPQEYEPSLDAELAAVAATPPELVRHQLRMAFRIGAPPPEALVRTGRDPGDDPRVALPEVVADVLAAGEEALTACLAEQLDRCWHTVLAPSWPTLRRILDDDVRHRATLASRVGLGEIVSSVHPRLTWDGTRMTLRLPYDITLAGAPGLVLLPSVFLPGPAVWLAAAPADSRAAAPAEVVIGYPARGRGQVWNVPEPPAGGADVFGPRRAALLTDLGVPRSTSELAARHRLSPATVSYHLGRLHQAGLVRRRQDGHSVLYERTPRAAALLQPPDPRD